MKLESLGAVHTHTHTPSLYKIINNKIEIDRGDYANMSFDINGRHNLLFLYAKICFICEYLERRVIKNG